MDRTTAGERGLVTAPDRETEAMEFVRFCHRRRRVGWPELYDEMCAVAGRGLYHGYGPDDLAAIGIGFGLFQMPALAGLVARVVAEDHDRRRLTAAALRASLAGPDPTSTDVANGVVQAPGGSAEAAPRTVEAGAAEVAATDLGSIRIAVAAGA